MKDYLNEVISNKENGLYICPLPTGYGKSYEIFRKISELAKDENENRKIIYITTLNKNLNEDELSSFFDSKEQYNKKVLRIRSNFNSVKDKIFEIENPVEFRTDAYSDLKRVLERYNDVTKGKINDKQYVEDIKKKAEEKERLFRKEIIRHLSTNFKNKKQRLEAICDLPKYKWIGQLYPAVFTDNHQVLIMSVSKFVQRNTVLIEPS